MIEPELQKVPAERLEAIKRTLQHAIAKGQEASIDGETAVAMAHELQAMREVVGAVSRLSQEHGAYVAIFGVDPGPKQESIENPTPGQSILNTKVVIANSATRWHDEEFVGENYSDALTRAVDFCHAADPEKF